MVVAGPSGQSQGGSSRGPYRHDPPCASCKRAGAECLGAGPGLFSVEDGRRLPNGAACLRCKEKRARCGIEGRSPERRRKRKGNGTESNAEPGPSKKPRKDIQWPLGPEPAITRATTAQEEQLVLLREMVGTQRRIEQALERIADVLEQGEERAQERADERRKRKGKEKARYDDDEDVESDPEYHPDDDEGTGA